MDAVSVGQSDLVQLAEFIVHVPVIEADGQPAFFLVDAEYPANVAVEHFLVAVIDVLDHLVAGRIGRAVFADLQLALAIQAGLQLDFQRSCAQAAAVHWRQHLDIIDRIETEALRSVLCHDLDQFG